jgi:hypothetical protein
MNDFSLVTSNNYLSTITNQFVCTCTHRICADNGNVQGSKSLQMQCVDDRLFADNKHNDGNCQQT